MLRGGFLTGGMLDDILLIALDRHGRAGLGAGRRAPSTARSGSGTSRDGEQLGRSADPPLLPAGGWSWPTPAGPSRCCSASSRRVTGRAPGRAASDAVLGAGCRACRRCMRRGAVGGRERAERALEVAWARKPLVASGSRQARRRRDSGSAPSVRSRPPRGCSRNDPRGRPPSSPSARPRRRARRPRDAARPDRKARERALGGPRRAFPVRRGARRLGRARRSDRRRRRAEHLGLGELERTRDELAARLAELRAALAPAQRARTRARELLERMRLEPGRYTLLPRAGARPRRTGCGIYEVRPRHGPDRDARRAGGS